MYYDEKCVARIMCIREVIELVILKRIRYFI